jgi:5-methylthioadenosine/S-adenosylhomocysteine deaminase
MPVREPAELLIEARWLLPVAPANCALADQAVALSGGRILAVGPASELRERFEPRERIRREQHVLLPGLVNAHTSACHTLLRGLPVRGPRRRWLAECLAPVEARCLSADFVRDGTRLGIAEMLRAGITCFADLSLYPEEAARTAAAAHMRAVIGLPVADGPTPWADSATAHLARAARVWDEYRSDARIGLYFAPLTRHGVSEATLLRVRRVADELDARVSVHLGELADFGCGAQPHAYARAAPAQPGTPELAGVADSAGSGWGSLQQLHALQLLRPGFTAIGPGACARAELDLAARQGVSFICCPQADLRLGAGAPLCPPPPAHSGLGTDSPLAAGALDMLAELRVAALVFGISAAEALRMATLGGATALGLAAEIGSLEAGKAADLTCIDLGALASQPGSAIHDALAFATHRGQVSDVWCAGRLAVSAGRPLSFDEAELAMLPQRWAGRLNLEAAA